MKMNITELKAHNWLTRQGYTGIVFQGLKNPDFITANSEAFEVKKCRDKTIVFSNRQFKQLCTLDNISVLVFNKGMEPIAIIPFRELADIKGIVDSPKYWKDIRVHIVTMSKLAPREHINGTYYTIEDVASILKVHIQTVYRYIYSGKLEAIRLPRFIRITEEQLDKFIGVKQR